MTTPATSPTLPTSEARAAAARCVGDWDEFRHELFGRAPRLWPGIDDRGYGDLLSIDDVDALVTQAGLRFPAVKVVRGGRKIAASEFTRSGMIGGVRVDDLVDAAAVRDAFAGGATIVLASLHRYHPALTRFCDALEAALSHPVQVNAYITPPNARGLDLHWDTHDVFVLQCFGEKHWRVHGEGFRAPLRHQHRSGSLDAPAGDPVVETTLRPGDSLYIPRGYVHGAETRDAASAHLTIGILTVAWVDVLRGVLDAMEDSAELREALPVGFDREDVTEIGRAKLVTLADLITEADVAQLAARRRRKPPVRLAGQIASLAKAGRLTDASVLRRAQPWALETENGKVTIATPTRRLRLPVGVQPALEHLATGEPVVLRDLSRWLDAAGRETLAKRLVREGVVAVC